MYDRSKTPVRDFLATQTRDPLTANDTIDPILSRLFVEAGRHVPGGGSGFIRGQKLTVDAAAGSLDDLIAATRLWSDRAVEAERELADLRRERDTVRAYFGVTS